MPSNEAVGAQAIAAYVLKKIAEEANSNRSKPKLKRRDWGVNANTVTQIRTAIREKNMTRVGMMTLLELSIRVAGMDKALDIFKDAMNNFSPNRINYSSLDGETLLLRVMEDATNLSNRENPRPKSSDASVLDSLCGHWLETVKDQNGNETFSVGIFYRHVGGFGYAGQAYNSDGLPTDRWSSNALVLSDDQGRIFYPYRTRSTAGGVGEGYGIIDLNAESADGSIVAPTMTGGFFVNFTGTNAIGIPIPKISPVTMMRLKDRISLANYQWASIDAAIKALYERNRQ